ncbi:MAG TPA: hypothetical protein VI911_11470 [Patescibacteria group bacterium]|nr:hypothetical protein [Patescibacteria group bacterium]
MSEKEIKRYLRRVLYSCKNQGQLDIWFNWAIKIINNHPELISGYNYSRYSSRLSFKHLYDEFKIYLESKASDTNS